jgi:hypothetical protein
MRDDLGVPGSSTETLECWSALSNFIDLRPLSSRLNSSGYYDHDQQPDGTERDCSYFARFRLDGLANLTPGPPPF